MGFKKFRELIDDIKITEVFVGRLYSGCCVKTKIGAETCFLSLEKAHIKSPKSADKGIMDNAANTMRIKP